MNSHYEKRRQARMERLRMQRKRKAKHERRMMSGGGPGWIMAPSIADVVNSRMPEWHAIQKKKEKRAKRRETESAKGIR